MTHWGIQAHNGPVIGLLAAAAVGSAALTPTVPTSKPISAPIVSFVENLGQWHPEAKYMHRGSGFNAWITDRGMVIDQYRFQPIDTVETADGGEHVRYGRSSHAFKVTFESASNTSSASGSKVGEGVQNYYDGGLAFTGVRQFGEVNVSDIAPGASARYYLDAGQPRYDVILAPGADANAIRMRYEGVQNLRVEADGSLAFDTSFGTVREANLLAYQRVGNKIQPVQSTFVVNGDTVSFRVGAYDRSKQLIIDPQVLVRSSYVTGSGADVIRKVKVFNGDIMTATSTASANFPTSTGAAYSTNNGTDIALSRFGGESTANVAYPAYTLKYSTYINIAGTQGPTGFPDVGSNIGFDVHTNGSPVFTFATSGVGPYPLNGTAGVTIQTAPYDNSASGSDAYVGVLEPQHGKVYSGTLFGGTLNESPWSLDVSSSGNIVIGGNSTSTDYPLIGDQTLPNFDASSDGFVAVLNFKLTAVPMSMLIGRGQTDTIRAVMFTPQGDVIAGGTTEIPTTDAFPGSTGRYDSFRSGTRDGFLARINLDGGINYSTLIGSNNGNETLQDIGMDNTGDVYAVGYTFGATASVNSGDVAFPTTGAVDATYDGSGTREPYIIRMNGSFTRKVACTLFGSALAESIEGLIVRPNGQVVVGGYITRTTAGSVPVTSDQLTPAAVGTVEGFVARLNSGFTVLQHGTMIGGTGNDYVYGIAVGNDLGNVVAVGNTASLNFPIVNGYQTTGDASAGFIAELGYYSDPSALILDRTVAKGGYHNPTMTTVLNIPVQLAGGQLAYFASTNPAVASPAISSFLMPQGTSLYPVLVNTNAVVSPTPVTLSVTSSGTTRSVVLTVY